MNPESRCCATFSWQAKDVHITGPVDRLAVAGTDLMVLSWVGVANDVKAFRAALYSDQPSMLRVKHNEHTPSWMDRIYPSDDKYRIWSHRLGYGQYHVVAVAKTVGLMLKGSDESLWAELKHHRYTTPLLRAWVPWIRKQLEDRNVLFDINAFGCQPRRLIAITRDLDEIVEQGLIRGFIQIKESA